MNQNTKMVELINLTSLCGGTHDKIDKSQLHYRLYQKQLRENTTDPKEMRKINFAKN